MQRVYVLRAGVLPGLAVGLACAFGAGTPHALAAKKRRPAAEASAPKADAAAAPLSADRLAQLGRDLRADDENRVVEALKALGGSGAPNAADPVIELLSVGATPWVAAEALESLRKLKDARALQVLTLYAGNRNPKVRSAAVKALGALPDERVVGTLLERLGDFDPEVRTASAEVLGARKEKRAVDRLFKLVAQNDAGAAGPLGLLAPPDLVPQIAELKGRVGDGVLAAVFGELIKRGEVPDRLRVDVVRTLGQIPGAEATTALVEYVATVPPAEARPSKDEAQRLIDQRSAQ